MIQIMFSDYYGTRQEINKKRKVSETLLNIGI